MTRYRGLGKISSHESARENEDVPRVFLPIRFVHETPLQSTGETSASTPTKTRIFDGLDNP